MAMRGPPPARQPDPHWGAGAPGGGARDLSGDLAKVELDEKVNGDDSNLNRTAGTFWQIER